MRMRWNTPTQIRRSLTRVNNMLISREINYKQAEHVHRNASLILRCLELEEEQKKQREDI